MNRVESRVRDRCNRLSCLSLLLVSCLAMLVHSCIFSLTPPTFSIHGRVLPSATTIDIDGNEGADLFFSSNMTSGLVFDDAYSIENASFTGTSLSSLIRVSNTDRFIRFRSCCFFNGKTGILLQNASNVFIEDCMFHNLTVAAINMTASSNCGVLGSHFQSNNKAVMLDQGMLLLVENNSFFRNQVAVYMLSTSSINFSRNILVENDVGITIITTSLDNTFWNNYFSNNTISASDPYVGNSWDNGTTGNYWSDYITRYPSAIMINGTWSVGYLLLEYQPGIYDNKPVPFCDFPFPYFTVDRVGATSGEMIGAMHVGIQQPGNFTLEWDCGDGFTIGGTNLTNISHEYANPGLFSITLRVIDVDGDSRSFTNLNAVNVVAALVPGFGTNLLILFIVVGLSLVLLDRCSKRRWSFGKGMQMA